MRTNLIQSYVNGTPIAQQYNSDKAVKDFDVHKELANRTFIKPLPSNGKLLKPSLFDMPSVVANDLIYDWNAFRHAVKGEANDHELGRLNDVGMKVGGLAIASYLFTKKQTPMTKAFEFIGLASFFGAMDLWPKLFLQLPAYLVHGFNIRQKYEDNYGRKKLVFQDHQFIPWDLYSDKEINKIGDRLRVPKDIPNRREFIQEKMRKIALQNNTMWMLTAGFATPIMSALICNALEKPVASYLDRKNNEKAERLLTNFPQEISKFDFSKEEAALKTFLAENEGKSITPELVDNIHAHLSDGIDYVTATGIRKDLDDLLPVGKYRFSNETLNAVRDVLKESFAGVQLTEEELAKILPDNNAMLKAFTDNGLMRSEAKEFSEHSKLVQNLVFDNIERFVEENPGNPNARRLRFIMNQMVHSNVHGEDSKLVKAFKFEPVSVLTKELSENLGNISKILNDFKAKNLVLDRYAYIKVAQAPETILANSWNEISESLLKVMNFTPEEIRQARYDREIAGEVLRNKLEGITADKASYSKFVTEMEKLLSTLQSKAAALDVSSDESSLYSSLVNKSTFDESAKALRNAHMENTAESLVGYGFTSRTSLKDVQLSFVADRLKGVKSSFYRILNMADMYYKIAHVEGLDSVLTNTMPREVKEEVVELAKETLLEGHTSDFAVKFYQKRNPNPDKFDCSQIESVAGKVKNKYFGTHQSSELMELSNDSGFFESVMKLMYENNLHPDTYEKIKSSVILEDFMNYRKNVLDFLGCDSYYPKPAHLVNGKVVDSSSELKFLLMGCSPDEMFLKLFRQKSNSNKWFKTFGRLGAGLIGVTLLSQFFIGHMKKPQPSKEVK